MCLLGLDKEDKIVIPANVQALVRARETARAERDFKKSDELREEIRKLGFDLKDTPAGPVLSTGY